MNLHTVENGNRTTDDLATSGLLIAAGEDPYVISQRLGHASIRTTYDICGHLFEGRDRQAADALEAARAHRPRPLKRRNPLQITGDFVVWS